jgi:hypothetical protein
MVKLVAELEAVKQDVGKMAAQVTELSSQLCGIPLCPFWTCRCLATISGWQTCMGITPMQIPGVSKMDIPSAKPSADRYVAGGGQ